MINNRLRVLFAGVVIWSVVAGASAQQIECVSRNAAGTGTGDRTSWIIPKGYRTVAQGRYVAFTSNSRDLIPGGTFLVSHNLYVRDLVTGSLQRLTRDPVTGGEINCGIPLFDFSKNGRFIAFTCGPELIPDYTTRPVLFVRDLQAGTTIPVRMDADTGQPLYGSSFAISDDGQKVAFTTTGWNQGLPFDRNRIEDVYVFDLPTRQISLVSVDRAGTRAGNSYSRLRQLTGDGRYVLFSSFATNLVEQTVSATSYNLHVRDLHTGQTKLVNRNLAGNGGLVDFDPDYFGGHKGRISTNGRYVTFYGKSDDYVPGDHNGQTDVFQRDLVTGATALVSENFLRTGSGNAGAGSYDMYPEFAVTPDGRFIAFTSKSNDLVATDENGLIDAFVRDMTTGETRMVSQGIPRAAYSSTIAHLFISDEGRYVALVMNEQDTASSPYASRLYVVDLWTGQVRGVTNTAGVHPGDLFPAGFSEDSNVFAFYGTAVLTANDNNADYDMFVLRLNAPAKPNLRGADLFTQ